MVNEKPISTWSPSSLRKQMSAVFQNQIHYPFDVKPTSVLWNHSA